ERGKHAVVRAVGRARLSPRFLASQQDLDVLVAVDRLGEWFALGVSLGQVLGDGLGVVGVEDGPLHGESLAGAGPSTDAAGEGADLDPVAAVVLDELDGGVERGAGVGGVLGHGVLLVPSDVDDSTRDM